MFPTAMLPPDLSTDLHDQGAYDNAIRRFREQGIVLPTFGQLKDPATIGDEVQASLASVPRMAPDARNLFRVHWHNSLAGDAPSRTALPDHVVLPPELTGVHAPIVVLFGDRFPMITAHKVLAAYACLVPRLITGRFDPTVHRAIWPSTGNYARGGVAISRIMGCRGVAVLPEGMSKERFDWLDEWVGDPSDIIRTVGTESNVKEIYDACNELALTDTNVILNQFSEFANYLGHVHITGSAFGRVFESYLADNPGASLRAFVSATGSAGTIGAGDWLKHTYGSKIVAVEALECPTMLENGFGEHNIQGIGDKHIPLIHNVMNTDVVVGISDTSTDELDVVFNTEVGRRYLAKRFGVSDALLDHLSHFGFSSICNTLAAIKTARHFNYGPDDVIMTVATDGSALYPSERAKTIADEYGGSFDEAEAAEAVGEHLIAVDTANLIECTEVDRRRIFNLGYYTWVEQQGTPFEMFTARRDQSWWQQMWPIVDDWDAAIGEFNAKVASKS
ncbi:MAG: pyridoxal-5'-phosphate-dependent protein subunit beta [Acidimicrobiia bacterium]